MMAVRALLLVCMAEFSLEMCASQLASQHF